MKKFVGGMLVVLVILYIVLPDVVPGPVDDIIVALLGVAANRRFADDDS
ncbi:MAG: hypothetical protein ACOYBC_01780 [Bilifractor sp.]|jgi:hypothetical protein